MENDRDGVGWAEQKHGRVLLWCCEDGDGDGDANANGMDAAIQSNPDSGGFPSRC